jgi:hypothetical protein
MYLQELKNKFPKKIITDISLFICTYVLKIGECNGIKLPPSHCARFAINSAMKIFGWKKDYSFYAGNTWDLKYKEDVYEFLWSEEDSLPLNYNNLFDGLLICIYRPKSNYNQHRDLKNKPIKYTHLALLIKEDSNFSLDIRCLLDYFKDSTEYISFNDMFGNGKRNEEKMKLKEILINKDNYTQEELNIFKKFLVSKDNL